MPLTVHHLQASQSERVPWLCEELQIPYTLSLHQRAPVFAPPSIRDLNPLGQAPVIQEDGLTLAESAACVDYIVHRHGGGRLALPPAHPDYPDYLYWFHFANGTLQPALVVLLQAGRVAAAASNPPQVETQIAGLRERLARALRLLDARVAAKPWLAGDAFTVADIMAVTSLTTMRMFYPYDLSPYPGILAYLGRVVQREGYRRARAKADPELELMIEGKPPRTLFARLEQAKREAEGKL